MPSVPESTHAGVVGVGVDLVEVDRMRDTLARTPTIVERVFTADEAAWARAAKDPSERFAVRFAAKEAVLKSLGVGRRAWGGPVPRQSDPHLVGRCGGGGGLG